MLSVREKFGDDHSVDMVLKKHFGKVILRICFGGEPFDPRYNSGEINDLLKMYSLIPDYIFKNGKNIVTIPAETKKKAGINGIGSLINKRITKVGVSIEMPTFT